MTREEAKRIAQGLMTDFKCESETMVEFCNVVIKALEQEPVLDKVRTEIQDIAFDWQEIDGEHESFMVVDLNDALNIIDKYKAESEDK